MGSIPVRVTNIFRADGIAVRFFHFIRRWKMSGVTYIITVCGILLAKVLGFGRNVVFASEFGGTELTDIYFQVFSIATFLFSGIGAALSTLVIKNLNKPENSLPDAKKRFVSQFICRIGLALIIMTALMYLTSDVLVKILLPGIEDFDAAKKMIYIMLPSGLFNIIAYIIAGVLQNCKKYFITAIMSVPYNLIIILALIFFEVDIFTVAVVTTIGWVLHVVILLPDFYKCGFRFFYRADGDLPRATKEKSLEVLFIFISSMMFHMCLVFDKASVSHDEGAATTINYATNLFLTISSIFVVAMSSVSFPTISKHHESGEKNEVCKTVVQMISLLLAISVPFIMVAFIFGGDIVTLLYQRGEFTPELAARTASLFGIYTLGIFGYIAQELLVKLLYLESRYVIPVVGCLSIIGAKLIINPIAAPYGVIPIAVSTVVLFTVYAVIIAIAITRVAGNYFTVTLGKNLIKIFCAGLCALAAWAIFRFTGISLPGGRFAFLIPLAVCGAVYLAVVWFSGLVKVLLPAKK